MPPIEIPSNITGSNLEGEALLQTAADGSVFVLASNTHMSNPYSIYMMHIGKDGSLIDSARINKMLNQTPSMPFDFNNWFYLFNCYRDDGNYKKEILKINHNLTPSCENIPKYISRAVILGDDYYVPYAIEDSVGDVFGNKEFYSDTLLYFIKTRDFEHVSSLITLPVSSPIIDEFDFRCNDSHMAGFLNNTVLKGPDHHDIQVYYLTRDMKTEWHRQLTGKSTLARMWANDMYMDAGGNIAITGTSDDKVNFAAPGIFNDFTKKESFYSYSFVVVYSPEGKMLHLISFDKDEESMWKRQEYAILGMKNGKVLLGNKHRPQLRELDLKKEKIRTLLPNITPVEDHQFGNETYYYINDREFYRVVVKNGPLDTNIPPTYKVEKYSIAEGIAL